MAFLPGPTSGAWLLQKSQIHPKAGCIGNPSKTASTRGTGIPWDLLGMVSQGKGNRPGADHHIGGVVYFPGPKGDAKR